MTITLEAVATDGSRQADQFTVAINENIDRGDKIAKLIGVTTQNFTSIVAVNDYSGRFDIIKEGNDYFLIYKVLAPGTSTLDFEDRNFDGYFEQITFNFMNGSTLVDQASVDVQLNNINDAPRDLAYATVNNLNENAAQGSVIATGITVTDQDTVPAFRDFRYALVNADGTVYTGNNYQIDATTGVITVGSGGLPDVSASTQVTVHVRVTDMGGNGQSYREPVTFTVNPVAQTNTAPTTPVIQGAVGTINENAAGSPTSLVATVQSTDANGDAITYAFTGTGNPGNLFTIDNSGRIYFTGTAQDFETNDNLQSDAGGKFFRLFVTASDRTLTSSQTEVKVYLNNVNERPTNATLSGTGRVFENAGNDAFIGNFSVSDPDVAAGGNDGFVYNLTDNAGGRFKVDANGNLLVANGSLLDVPADTDYSITLQVIDKNGQGLAYTKTFTITVRNVDPANNNPDSLTFANNQRTVAVAENQAGVALGVLKGHDPDAADNANLEYFIAQNGDPSDKFEVVTTVNGPTLKLKNGVSLDFEQKESYTVRLRVEDGRGGSHEENFTINVTDVAEAVPNRGPTGLNLIGNTVQELIKTGSPLGSIGTLTASDADGDGLTYKIVTASGALADSDGRFKISGSQFMVDNAVMLDAEQAKQHFVTIQVSDGRGGRAQQTFAINVSDVSREIMSAVDESVLNDVIKASKTANSKDTLRGGLGDDQLWGGYGNDTLWGGAGKDKFVFHGKLGTSSTDRRVNYDTIKDYSVKDDSIWLDNDLFKSNKKLYAAIKKGTEAKPLKMASKFFTVGDKAKQADDYFVYDAKKRVLYYDADGSGSKAAIEMATFTNNKALKAFTVKELFFI